MADGWAEYADTEQRNGTPAGGTRHKEGPGMSVFWHRLAWLIHEWRDGWHDTRTIAEHKRAAWQ
jgi:hypothetical protein